MPGFMPRIHVFFVRVLRVLICAVCPASLTKIFPFSADPNHRLIPLHLVPTRGAARDRHERGTGCGGRGSADNERH
jgi:hypothetical protein